MKRNLLWCAGLCALASHSPLWAFDELQIGKELAVPTHLRDWDEYQRSIRDLIDFGRKLFTARWTSQEGAGPAADKRHRCTAFGSAKPSRIPTELQPDLRAGYQLVRRLPQFAGRGRGR